MTGPHLTAPAATRIVYADGREGEGSCPVLRELHLRLLCNGRELGSFACTDTDVENLVLGWLYTQGWIDAADQVASMEIQRRQNVAAVTLTGPLPEQRRPLERIPAGPAWKPEDVFTLAARFRQGMPIHDETGATHSCFLMRGGEIVYAFEDLSRHNAVDKAVGFALKGGIPLGECLLYTSGRLPEEQVRRAAAAGIGVLVSKATPTAEAVELARTLGVTLLCRAWEDRFERFA